jgi:hypothetical protein
MTFLKQLKSKHLLSMVLALGLVVAGTSPSWGADMTTPHSNAGEKAPWVDSRVMAIGLGVLGGVVVYGLVTRGIAWRGLGAGARFARTGLAGAAGLGGGWGGRWIFITTSGLVGALVGDWIYRSNQTPAH